MLEANERLNATALDRLDALGYNRPTHDLSEDGEHDTGSPNHFFDYVVPVPFETVAEQAVGALTEVFRVQHPNELVYTAWADDGPPLLFADAGPRARSDGMAVLPHAGSCPQRRRVEASRLEVLDDAFEGVEAEGDVVRVPFASAFVMVRVLDEPPVIHVFSPVVDDVTQHDRQLLEEVNQRNLAARFVRFAALGDTLVASHELFGHPFVPAHLVYAVSLLGDLATSIDDEFCDRFGGNAFFPKWEDERGEP